MSRAKHHFPQAVNSIVIIVVADLAAFRHYLYFLINLLLLDSILFQHYKTKT